MPVVINAVPASQVCGPVRRLPPLERIPVLVVLVWDDGTREDAVPARARAWTPAAVLVSCASPHVGGRTLLTWLPPAAVTRVEVEVA